MAEAQKRKNQTSKIEDENDDDDDDDMWIGPMPHEAAKPKKKKGHFLAISVNLSWMYRIVSYHVISL